ncbi:MAG: 4a-hydroxytetrahydrobiopterin dehydratase [Microcoleaceae cyanobacterium]
MSSLLSEAQIQQMVLEVPEWTVEGKVLKITRKFKDFVEAVDFVNKLVEPAEGEGHHPDLEISYNTVRISLTTHDQGGLTVKDFVLAKEISELT